MKNYKKHALKSAGHAYANNLLKTFRGGGVKPLTKLVIGLLFMSNYALGFTTTWIGNTASWGSNSNWDNGVPGEYDDVIIGNSAFFDLEIDGIEECNSITFIDNGIIYFSTSGINTDHGLHVHGDLLNYSDHADIVGNNNGVIRMSGEYNSVIDGTEAIELFHLSIGKDYASNKVDVLYSLSIWLTIKMVKGDLNSYNTLALRADLANATTACTTPFTSDSKITGRVTVEQRIPYSGEYYHYLGSPVSDDPDQPNTFYTLDAQMADNSSTASVYDWTSILINPDFPDWFVYDETACPNLTILQVQNHYLTELSVTLSDPQAEWALTTYGWNCNYNLLTNELPAGTGVLSRVDFDQPGDIVDWSGSLNDGHIRVELSNTSCDFGDGLNLVANPYPGTIDWELLYDINYADVEAFAYVWTPDAAAISIFGAGAGDGYFTVMDASNTTAIIPSPDWGDESGALKDSLAIGQGFFVRALADNSHLDFENTSRDLYNTVSHILRETKPKDALQLLLQSPSGKDYTNIYLDNSANDAYNNKEDALKMANPGLNLATLCDNKRLMINRIAKQKDEIEVPLIISQKAGESGTISIGKTNFESNEYVAIFIDKKLNNQQLITADFKYTFTSQTGEENDRFAIKFVKGNYTLNNGSNNLGTMYVSNSQLNILGNQMDNATIAIMDASGRMVQQESVIFTTSKAILNLNELSNGIYIVNVQGTVGNFNQKVFINK